MTDLRDKKFVLIGGGSGNAALLRGLKHHTDNISVIVNICDDGGSSGRIRRNLNLLPPGDIRNCLVALADDENEMASIMAKRFDDGTLHNESLGNLLLVALYELTGDYLKTIDIIKNVLTVKGNVYPITTECVSMGAVLKNGKDIVGESRIAPGVLRYRSPVDRVRLIPENSSLLEECRTAIREADVIIYSPGSLYTSLIPNLLIPGMSEELEMARAVKILMANAMSEHGETDGFTVSDIVRAVERHVPGRRIVDTVIYNTAPIDRGTLARYKKEHASAIENILDEDLAERMNFIGEDIICLQNGSVRHDADKLWELLERTI